jgi:hypothetical protein
VVRVGDFRCTTEHRSVLGNDGVEPLVDIVEIRAQLRHDPPGHENHSQAGATNGSNCREHLVIGTGAGRQRAVVVERERLEGKRGTIVSSLHVFIVTERRTLS